jgi:signal transduction histidine kinase
MGLGAASLCAYFIPWLVAGGSSGEPLSILGAAAVSSLVYISLGWAIATKPDHDFMLLIRRDLPGSAQRQESDVTLIPEAVAEGVLKQALRSGRWGKLLVGVSLAIYGALQLSYPFRSIMQAGSGLAWPIAFIVGASCKLAIAIGFWELLRGHMLFLDASLRRGVVAEDITKLTMSVEHDMRGPLHDLQILEQTIRRRFNHVDGIGSTCSEITAIRSRMLVVMDLVKLFRESPEKTADRSQVCDLYTIAHQAVSRSRSAHDKWVTKISIVSPGRHPTVRGIEERLVQATTNILNNALEARHSASPDRVVEATIRIGASEEDELATLAVENEGTEIPATDLPFLKEAYFSTKKSSENPNRGMGLFIADRIVTLHRGSLDFKSIDGCTRVTMTLPLRQRR